MDFKTSLRHLFIDKYFDKFDKFDKYFEKYVDKFEATLKVFWS